MYKKNLSTTKGSIIAETAICFPVFILSIALILSMMSKLYDEAKLFSRLCEEASNGMSVIGTVGAELPFMVSLGSENDISACVFYRPFAGATKSASASRTVYYFPKYGQRYHEQDCSSLLYNKNYLAISLDEALEMGLTPCSLCRPGGKDYFR